VHQNGSLDEYILILDAVVGGKYLLSKNLIFCIYALILLFYTY